ncbi:hypothetical protein CAP35_03030 [Chitinophagaceae bacterium IBVUCB1]|nr:hypothetical protein CAP35_03030 [Chitinophagaceae bacterium IBVUCB1]
MNKVLSMFVMAVMMFTANLQAQTPQYTYTAATGGNYIPLGDGATWDNYRSQFLYLPGDFAPAISGVGFITRIYFRAWQNSVSTTYNNFKVDIGNTTSTSLTGTYVTGLTSSIPASTVTLPAATANSWIPIDLPTPVYVDMSQPLVIDVSQTGKVGGIGGYILYAGGVPINPIYTGSTQTYGLTSNPTGTARRYSYQFGFDFFLGFPCNKVPESQIAGPDIVCPGKQFTLSPTTYYADATYAWEYSDNSGATWFPHPSTVGLLGEIKDAINIARSYRLTITCKNNSTFTFKTNIKEVKIAPFYYCYCDNGAASTAGLDIGNVKVINMNSGDTMLNNGNSTPPQNNTTANRAYTNFQYPPNKEVIMYRDTVYRFLISQINSAATFTPSNVAVFIDLDRNGIFDPGERVLTRNINGGSQIPNTEFDTYRIPMTAQIGLTGMRVILSSGNIDSCGFGMAQGEVEDYLVDMRYEPCNGPGNAGTLASTSTKLCPGYDYITENAGYETTKSELQKVWQVSGDNIFWTTISNTSNKDTLMRVFSGQPLYYKVRMVCPRTKDTTYTSALKIDAREGYKCYCFSQAVGGNPKNSSNPKDSSDIGGIVFHTFNTNTGGAHLLNMGAQEKRTDHTDLSPMQLDVDSTYGLTVYHTQRTAVHGDAKITVFMDFNNDKEYDAPYERVYTGYTNVGNFTVVDKVTIPSTVITGVPTGMRIILNNDIGPSIPSDEACGPYTSGETEDLMVQFNKRFAAGVGIVGGISNLGVFPNPAKDVCKVQFSGAKDAKEVSVSITSVTGQKVYQQMYKHDGGNFTQEVNVAKLSRGVYYVEVAADGQKAMQKLVLE